jgi:hypothetical protein
MATAVNGLIDQAEEILQDSGNDRWSATEHLAWLNFGQKAIVRHKPDAYPVKAAVQLASGLWQALPSASSLLLDATMNMGTDGSTVGVPISLVDRKWMDTALPTWTTETASTTVKHVIYDPKTQPKAYMVYPQSDGTNYIEIVTSDIPADASAGGNITLGDEYAEALLDYMLFRAYSRDADYVENAQRAAYYWQSFLMNIGDWDRMETLMHPKKGQEAE